MCKGNRYVIRNQTAGGKSIVEGVGTLKRFIGAIPGTPDETWEVEFPEDPGLLVTRIVLAGDWVE